VIVLGVLTVLRRGALLFWAELSYIVKIHFSREGDLQNREHRVGETTTADS